MATATAEQNEATIDRMALELVPSLRQEQVLAPQLRASLRVLQMDLPALIGEVRHEAEVNPVVEVEENGAMSPLSEELRQESSANGAAEEPPPEDEANLPYSLDEDAAERRQRFFDRQVASESLQEHLLAQIGAVGFSREDGEIAELIVGDINDDGRYVGSFEELSEVVGVTAEKLEGILRRIQEFDPPGVGARTLRECLEIQARQMDVPALIRRLVLRIVECGLGMVARQEMQDLAKLLGVTSAECQVAVAALRTLEPKPGRPFLANGRHPQFIRPELEVEMSNEQVTLTSCEHELPVLTINPVYREMADNAETAQETQRYLQQHIGAAELLQEAIRRRGETILKVAEVVFAEQFDFFAKGFEALRPLTIEEVARRTGFHGTTVGRAVRGKYVRTPRGVYELRRFFCVGRLGADGGSGQVSATSVKCRLANLVKAEETAEFTDEELARELGKSGMRISRRTVAKYRFELGIPSASERGKRRVSHEHAYG